ncbi:MAG: hypothetical protein AAGC73_09085 [Verrucomicrobiota bacterium]
MNSSLSSWSIYFVMLGPMVVFPALYMRHAAFFVCTLLTGMWVDAAMPAPFGLFTTLFLIAGTGIFHWRIRFRAEHNYHPSILAHTINALAIIAITFTNGYELIGVSSFWIQFGITLIASHLALLLIAPWFFNLQRLCIHIFHLESEPESFPTS